MIQFLKYKNKISALFAMQKSSSMIILKLIYRWWRNSNKKKFGIMKCFFDHNKEKQLESDKTVLELVIYEVQTSLTSMKYSLDKVLNLPIGKEKELKSYVELMQKQVKYLDEFCAQLDENNTCQTSYTENSYKTILIVEHERGLRQLLQQTLCRNYHVVACSNGAFALSVLREMTVDMVISGVKMPQLNGCELCARIKQKVEWGDIPVILMSSKSSVEARLINFGVEAQEYIEKPFSMKYLKERMDVIFEKQQFGGCQKLEIEASKDQHSRLEQTDRCFIEKFYLLVDRELGNESLDIDLLSRELGVSQPTLYRKVRSLLGVTPTNYIQHLRLKRAETLLTTSENVRISSVAYEVGFASAGYFSICFAKQYGMTPKEYIQNKTPKIEL